ncbi:alpha/beta fold hydrolase [uncultured Halovibrio sp.]|uniref:alpha/beta fold hydrolase n=1 Tax=uncultured Halovibrio sp. TaxID=985049 RepID=UPI0025EAC8CC|nr:alpha/beta fold hydrolase [uncultured Halovibrio sp.]
MRTRTLRRPQTELHIVEDGDPANPAILFLHGFPDCHDLWLPHMQALSSDYHVIGFDMRGAGQSTPPARAEGYRIPCLLEDIDAVITATQGGEGTAHLVGHDWGSIIGWSFVADPVYGRRAESWTSLSGPHLGAAAEWVRNGILKGGGDRKPALNQVLHSWYMLALNVPGLGQAVFSTVGTPVYRAALTMGGVPADHPHLARSRDEVTRLTRHTFQLYRQNALSPPPTPRPGSIRTPSQILILEEDAFATPAVCEAMTRCCQQVSCKRLAANHWAPVTHPEWIQERIRGLVASLH